MVIVPVALIAFQGQLIAIYHLKLVVNRVPRILNVFPLGSFVTMDIKLIQLLLDVMPALQIRNLLLIDNHVQHV